MRAARLKTRADLLDRPNERKTPPPARTRSGRHGPGILSILGLIFFAGWGGTMTYLWYAETQRVAVLREEQAALVRTYEDKVKGLTRRLVGVASSQLAGPEGAESRMADLIERQVEIEARQALLGAIAQQVSALGTRPLPAPGQTVALAVADPSWSPEALGIDPAIIAQVRAQVAQALRARERLTMRDRMESLSLSMQRVEGAEGLVLNGLARLSSARVNDMRGVLSELGLEPDKVRLPAPRVAVGGPLIPVAAGKAGAFEQGLRQVNESMAMFNRWRDLMLTLPLQRPLDGHDNTTSNFGTRSDPFTGQATMHAGMDFRAETGTPVYATAAGKVARAGVAGGYGNLVEIDHGNGFSTRYGHLSAFDVSEGQFVSPGMIIGRVGSTGRSTGPHLHYETRRNDEALDPMRFLTAGARLPNLFAR